MGGDEVEERKVKKGKERIGITKGEEKRVFLMMLLQELQEQGHALTKSPSKKMWPFFFL